MSRRACATSACSAATGVALLLGNRIEFPLTMFAAAHLGAVTVLLGTRQQKPEIAHVLTDCGAGSADP
jgi:long-chain acyl-CoA synthetase